MEDTAKKFCSILLDVLQNKGVRNMVCSPGSRNLPLLLAAASRPSIKKYFIADERTAGFVGLGISLVKQEPVALICTSGTALLNYAPSIAEAYYQGVPLIIISADRPVQWIDQDDSQTLRQDGVLENFVKKSFTIPAVGEDNKELQWYVNRIANEAVLEACSHKPGPVHFNIHLAEPLGLKTKFACETPRIVNSIIGDSIVNKEIIKSLAKQLSESKVLLIAGFLLPDSFLQRALSNFSRNPNVTVMAETISNVHLNNECYSVDSVLSSFDEKTLDSLAPDIVISIGGALISRKLKEYLRRNKDKFKHWSIGYTNNFSDPFMSLSLKVEVETSRFFKNINSALLKFKIEDKVKNYKDSWTDLRRKALLLKDKFIKESSWSELKAFDIILKSLPSNYNLFLSNGTAIRYAQIINYKLPHASYCNRGVSGIDGCVSTSIGGSFGYKGNTLIITGDLSMAYDIGSLGVKNIPENFKIIVIDNQGGGIFRFIPSTSNFEEREEYLCQAPVLPLKDLSKGYKWDYFEINDEESLHECLPKFFNSKNKSILKVVCDGFLSADILKEYMNLKYFEN